MNTAKKMAPGAGLTVARPGAERDVVRIDPLSGSTPAKLRVAAYARVSTDLEKQQTSYEAQMRHYTQVITQNPKWQFIDIYADEGITGTTTEKRDDFHRMMADCRKGRIDRILIKSISRFCRNTLDSIKAVRELTSLGVTVMFEKEGIDTGTMRGELIFAAMSDFAQNESLSMSGNLRRGIRMRMENGTYRNHTEPYGYRYEGKELVVDDQEAPTIRWIFKQYLKGTGSDRIALALNMLEVPTKSVTTEWSPTMVRYILQNERYMGDALFQKKYSTDTLPFRRVINNGEADRYYYTDIHPPIISRETFQLVQELYEHRRKKKNWRPPEKQHPFSRKVLCGECGRAYRYKITSGKPYWVCRRHDRSKTLCGGPRISEQALKDAFVRLYNKLKLHQKSILGTMLNQLYDTRRCVCLGNPQVVEINDKIARCSEQTRILSGLVAKGYMDSALFHVKKQENEAQAMRLREEKNRVTDTDDLDKLIDHTKELLAILEDGPERIEGFNAELFSEMVDKIIVEDTGHAVFRLSNGLDVQETLERMER